MSTGTFTTARRAIIDAVAKSKQLSGVFRETFHEDPHYCQSHVTDDENSPTSEAQLPAIRIVPSTARVQAQTNVTQLLPYTIVCSMWFGIRELSQAEEALEAAIIAIQKSVEHREIPGCSKITIEGASINRVVLSDNNNGVVAWLVTLTTSIALQIKR